MECLELRRLKVVAIDMSAAYQAAIARWLPDTVTVVDHFHVAQAAHRAPSELRRPADLEAP